jgi:hypothetical protein
MDNTHTQEQTAVVSDAGASFDLDAAPLGLDKHEEEKVWILYQNPIAKTTERSGERYVLVAHLAEADALASLRDKSILGWKLRLVTLNSVLQAARRRPTLAGHWVKGAYFADTAEIVIA